MFKTIFVALFLVTNVEAKLLDVGLQPYIYCTTISGSVEYELRIENAAVGTATGIKLSKFENNNWVTVAQEKITKIVRITTEPAQPPNFPEGNFTEIMEGNDFIGVRTVKNIKPPFNVMTDETVLKNLTNVGELNLAFTCTTVQ